MTERLPLAMRPGGPMGGAFARVMEAMNAPSYSAVLEAVKPCNGEALLEIGFGTGAFLKNAAQRMGGGKLAGVDPAPLMVSMARRKLAQFRTTFELDLREADSSHLGWNASSFNTIVAIHSFQFWPEPDVVIPELRSMLKPNGQLCLCLRQHGQNPPDWLPNPISRETDETDRTLSLLVASGFANVHVAESETRALLLLAHAP